MDRVRSESLDRLYHVILDLQTVEECYDFFEDLCTIKELRDLSQRLEVAFLLDQGLSYQQVAAQTGVSSATICRVKKCLDYGSGGYRRAIDRETAKENAEVKDGSKRNEI